MITINKADKKSFGKFGKLSLIKYKKKYLFYTYIVKALLHSSSNRVFYVVDRRTGGSVFHTDLCRI